MQQKSTFSLLMFRISVDSDLSLNTVKTFPRLSPVFPEPTLKGLLSLHLSRGAVWAGGGGARPYPDTRTETPPSSLWPGCSRYSQLIQYSAYIIHINIKKN